MTRIEKALAFFKGVSRCQIIEEYCPFEILMIILKKGVGVLHVKNVGIR